MWKLPKLLAIPGIALIAALAALLVGGGEWHWELFFGAFVGLGVAVPMKLMMSHFGFGFRERFSNVAELERLVEDADPAEVP